MGIDQWVPLAPIASAKTSVLVSVEDLLPVQNMASEGAEQASSSTVKTQQQAANTRPNEFADKAEAVDKEAASKQQPLAQVKAPLATNFNTSKPKAQIQERPMLAWRRKLV